MIKPKILIVEDETLVAQDIGQQLLELGYEPVAEARMGEEATRLTEQLRPDLVLMDIQLAGEMDGIAAAQIIRERFSIPVVFLTALAGDAIINQAKITEPFGYVIKPFDERELRTVIEMALYKHQAEVRQRESREEQAAILRTALDGYWLLDMAGRILDVNDAVCRTHGYTRAEMLRMAISDFDANENSAEISKQIQRILHDGSARFERTHRCKDGSLVQVEISATYRATFGGRIIAFFHDITERKRAEKALELSKQRLELAHRSAGAGTWDWDMIEQQLEWSRELYSLFGLDPEGASATFETWKQVLHPEDRANATDCIERAIRMKMPLNNEYRVVHPDGRIRWISALGNTTYDQSGQPVRMTGICIDITEGKQTAAALQELKVKVGSQEIFHVLVESASDGFWLLDKQFLTVYVNPSVEQILGYTRQEMVGRSWYDFGDPEWVARAKELEKRRATGVKEPHQFLFIHKGGRKVLTRIATTPLYDKDGNFDGALGVLSDLTRQKEAEDALELKNMLNVIAQSAGIGMSILNPDYTITWHNSLLEEWFGPLGKTRGRNCFEVFEHRDAVCSNCPAQITFQTGRIATAERSGIVTPAGADRIIALTTSPIRDASGNVIQVVEIAQDITERKQAEAEKAKLEAQFQQAQKMESVGRLAGGVAHDFNNMLQVILANTDMALGEIPPDSPLRESLQEVRNCAGRSADLTRQLLAFARRQTIAPAVLDLNETVGSMLKLLRRLIGDDIDLTWLPAQGLGLVKMDPTQVDQILANLCVNARDAIEGVGKVTIETANIVFDAAYCADHPGYVAGEYVRLTVSDNGCGMDKTTLPQIFEPFFTTKGLGEGTGLGLATVYGIVKQNHGFISVYSEPGHGTTFTLYLPRLAGEAIATGTTTAAEPPRSSGETVLLVEDEPAVLAIARIILVRLGYAVLTAGTPSEAIRLAGAHAGEIHLLITDVVMPEMNGLDLEKRLLSLHPKLKCLFMSGYTANVIAHHGVLKAGVNFIQKPFSLGDLAAKVRATLDENKP